MELIKKPINTSVVKSSKYMQITIDDDFNVPDLKQDIDKIIESCGQISVEEVEAMVDKVRIKGNVGFKVLYGTQKADKPIDSLEGTLDFEEVLNLDSTLPTDVARTVCNIDDLNISMINSRKLSVRSLIGINATIADEDVLEGAVELEDAEDIQCLNKVIPITNQVNNKKDTFRIRDEIAIPSNKPNVFELIWSSVLLQNQEAKILDKKINIKGDLQLFAIYLGEEEHMPIQYLQVEIPFSGDVECSECSEEMIGDVAIGVGSVLVEVRPDADGEERILNVDVSLDLDIKIYEDTELNLLWDAYSPASRIENTCEDFVYETLIARNNAKTKLSQKVSLRNNQAKILQICNVEGSVKIDDITPVDNGIQIDGVVDVKIIYVSSDDKRPLSSLNGMVPFSYVVEISKMCQTYRYSVVPKLEQLSAIMIDGDEAEIKATVGFGIMVFCEKKARAIKNIEIKPIDYEEINNLPGIIGYIVKEDDTLWSIAKRYYTTIDSIKTINNLDSNELPLGKKLVIVKG